MNTDTKLDVGRFIKGRFGGPAALRDKLKRSGYDLSERTIYSWSYRNRIPGSWMVVLNTLAEKERKPLHLSNYLMDEKEDEPEYNGSPDGEFNDLLD